jgi:hypothetical protein
MENRGCLFIGTTGRGNRPQTPGIGKICGGSW